MNDFHGVNVDLPDSQTIQHRSKHERCVGSFGSTRCSVQCVHTLGAHACHGPGSAVGLATVQVPARCSQAALWQAMHSSQPCLWTACCRLHCAATSCSQPHRSHRPQTASLQLIGGAQPRVSKITILSSKLDVCLGRWRGGDREGVTIVCLGYYSAHHAYDADSTDWVSEQCVAVVNARKGAQRVHLCNV